LRYVGLNIAGLENTSVRQLTAEWVNKELEDYLVHITGELTALMTCNLSIVSASLIEDIDFKNISST